MITFRIRLVRKMNDLLWTDDAAIVAGLAKFGIYPNVNVIQTAQLPCGLIPNPDVSPFH